MNSNRERWLQLALVAVCAALEEVECTDEALTEALFVGLPGLKIDDITAAAVAEALQRSSTLKEAAATLDRSRGFIYDSLKRRRQEWVTADWAAYGAELRRRRLLAGWSVAELSRRVNLSPPIIYQIEQGRGRLRPSELTLAKLAAAMGMPTPPTDRVVDDKAKKDPSANIDARLILTRRAHALPALRSRSVRRRLTSSRPRGDWPMGHHAHSAAGQAAGGQPITPSTHQERAGS